MATSPYKEAMNLGIKRTRALASNYYRKIIENTITSPIYDVAKKTPLQEAKYLSELTHNKIWLKREDVQPMFSFKLRGAYNKIHKLSHKEKENGIIACSAGNHAQGVAYSANKLGIDATIVMPKVTPQIKLNAVKNLGANVIVDGDNFDQAKEIAYDIMKEENKTLIHPYDDVDVIAGQGTIGLEILQQIQQINTDVDRVFCCVGGGGLISGIGLIIKHLRPKIQIIGVEAEDGSSMTQSLQAGKRITLDSIGTYADGAAVKLVGEHTFKICQNVVDDMITVSNHEIKRAIIDGYMDTRTILEPAGALAIAGSKKYLGQGIMNSNNIVITSGANFTFRNIRDIANISEENEAYVSITIPEQIGSFKTLYDIIYPRAITQFTYRYKCPKNANILLGFKGENKRDMEKTIKLLKKHYEVHNLQDNYLALDHLGNSIISNCKTIEDEKLFRFQFPEYPGALEKFLNTLGNDFNVTLFNYKNQGGDIGKVLVGLQSHNLKLEQFLNKLDYEYYDETDNFIYNQFLK